MKVAVVKFQVEVLVQVEDSTTIEEATQIVLFEYNAESSIKSDVLDKLKGHDAVDFSVDEAEFLDV